MKEVFIVCRPAPGLHLVAFEDESDAHTFASVKSNETGVPYQTHPLKLFTSQPRVTTKFFRYIGVGMDGDVKVDRTTATLIRESDQFSGNLKPVMEAKTRRVSGFTATYSWGISVEGTDEEKVRLEGDRRLGLLQQKIADKKLGVRGGRKR